MTLTWQLLLINLLLNICKCKVCFIFFDPCYWQFVSWLDTWGSQAMPKGQAANLSGRPNLNNLDKNDPEVLRAWRHVGQTCAWLECVGRRWVTVSALRDVLESYLITLHELPVCDPHFVSIIRTVSTTIADHTHTPDCLYAFLIIQMFDSDSSTRCEANQCVAADASKYGSRGDRTTGLAPHHQKGSQHPCNVVWQQARGQEVLHNH